MRLFFSWCIVVAFVLLAAGILAAESPQLPARCVPPSLMLHSRDREFLINELIPWLDANSWQTLTYQQYVAALDAGEALPAMTILLSIDDLEAEWLNSYFVDMVEALHEHGYVATLAMHPFHDNREQAGGEYPRLRQWAEWGFELASHTIGHADLVAANSYWLDYQVGESIRRIEAGTGEIVTTLVLPGGAIALKDNYAVADERVFAAAAKYGITAVVGITNGRLVPDGVYTTAAEPPYYLGRVGPVNRSLTDTAWEFAHWYWQYPSECH